MKKFVLDFKYVFLMALIFSVFLFCNYTYRIQHQNDSLNQIQYTHNYCQMETNILFLKTYKTAGTTLQNILLRFAIKYHRLVAIPTQVFRPIKFSETSLFALKPGYNYNIFAQHSIFAYEEMRAVMPNDTKYITILREPVARMESHFRYKHFETFFGRNIVGVANLNISGKEWLEMKDARLLGIFGRNQMAFDLGVDPALFDDEEAMSEKVQQLDKQFDLVMITELFDQSLILMKEKLCWKDWNDVISFKINARKSESRKRLSSEQKENLRRINRADQMIYDHFYQKLLGQIDAFGKKKMEEEVEKLHAATEEMHNFCLDTEINDKNVGESQLLALKREAENDEVCQYMIKDDAPLTMDIFSKQKQFYTISNELFSFVYFATRIGDFVFKTLYVN